MTRLDLVCKLIAPSLLPLIVSNFSSRSVWIMLLTLVTFMFWTLEVWFAHILAKENDELWLPKTTTKVLEGNETYHTPQPGFSSMLQKLYSVIYQSPRMRLKYYFAIPVWPASISISILQLSVLAYSATVVTYLLEVGYSLSAVTLARGSGTIMALCGTFIIPLAATYLRKRYSRSQGIGESEIEGRVVRKIGLWGVSSQFFFMVRNPPVCLVMYQEAN